MSRKIAILFAVLAITYVAQGAAVLGSASPSSAYSIAPAAVFTNATDTAFTNIQNDCYFTAGFDNTTNYVWCNAGSKSQAVTGTENVATTWNTATGAGATATPPTTNAVLTLQRRAINASSPGTKNATLDTKITTSITANDGGMICAGVGYLGIAYSNGAGSTGATLQSDVYLAYIAVNGTSATSVKITSSAATVRSKAQTCFFDNGIFYVIYTTDAASQSTPDYTKNTVMIQGVNVTSGTVFYNSTGGVSVLTPSTTAAIQFSNYQLIPTNWTGYGSSIALLTYTDSSGAAAGTACGTITTSAPCSKNDVGNTYKYVPITLATGAPGSVVPLGTASTSTTIVLGSDSTTTSTTVITTFSTAGGFGSLSTYGVAVNKKVRTTVDKWTGSTSAQVSGYTIPTTDVYTSSMFLNGSTTASTTFNLTNPTGYYLGGQTGYSTNAGFGLVSYFMSTTSTATSFQLNLDTYYANGTSILSAQSLGTFSIGTSTTSAVTPQFFIDKVGSPWIGYTMYDSNAAWTGLGLLSGYAGEIAVNVLSANALASIFTTLALMIAALFAF